MKKTNQHTRPTAPSRRRGFAFTEVLFAVMVLGLGFIMIAAMFPVTISQTQATAPSQCASCVGRMVPTGAPWRRARPQAANVLTMPNTGVTHSQ